MAVLAECPICRRKQSTKNKLCIGKLKGNFPCEADLTKLKRQKDRVRYYISYRIPGENGKQRMESVGYSIKEARDADGKRRVQKRENRIFDMLPESTITFNELSDWYLDLSSVKKLASYRSIGVYLNNFNQMHGDKIVGDIKLEDLEEHQARRKKQGLKAATIDQEIGHARTAVTKAFDNDKIDGQALKPFRRIKKLLRRGANARKRIFNFEEYLKLLDAAPAHFKSVLIVAYHTGMRSGELQKLQWKHIDREEMFIRLPGETTKSDDPRDIPINHHVKSVLDNLPRAITHNYVFIYMGRPLTHKNGFVNQMKSTCKDAGVPYGRETEHGVTMHDMRGTVKTNMLSAGVDKVYRDLILGHSLKGMDVHYLAPREDDLKREMERFTQWLDDQLEKQMLTIPLIMRG